MSGDKKSAMQELNKSLLKQARQAIKSENYPVSLRLCKQVLDEDKENYTALVFLAVSYQGLGQSQQALKGFKNAIKVNPANPLAYNGLASFYEKNSEDNETKIDLVKTYIELLKLETAEKKLLEYAQKLSRLSDYGDLCDVTKALYDFVTGDKCQEGKDELLVSLADLFGKIRNIPEDLVPMYEHTLRIILSDPKKIRTELYNTLLGLLYKQSKIEELLKEAQKLHELFEIDSNSLRWTCKVFNETYIETDKKMILFADEIQKISENLLRLDRQNSTAHLTKLILDYDRGKFDSLMDKVKQALEGNPSSVHAWIFMAQCCQQLRLNQDLVYSLGKIDKLMNNVGTVKDKGNDRVNVIVRRLTIQGLANSTDSDDLKRALDEFDKADDDTKSVTLPSAVLANITLNNTDEAKKLLENLKTSDPINYKLLSAKILHKLCKYEEALELLLSTEEEDEVAMCDWWLEIGCLYWDSGRQNQSLMPFLKAAKIEPYNYKCFLLLGHFYGDSENLDKARRCYEKAFKLNSKCIEAGVELSKIYRKLKNWDANLSLLKTLTADVINQENLWAWMQLGLNYLELADYDKAVNSLRFVIRIDENNVPCWESLADAYLAKGAYTSALKCYAKAAELSNSALYPLLQMANIKQILGEYVEARSDFEKIISSNKLYVPALKGMAETCMYQAKECFKCQRKGTARDHAQTAADHLVAAIQQRSDLSCLWKLLGDSCYFVASKLPARYSCMLMPVWFLLKDSDNSENCENPATLRRNEILETQELFQLAARSYTKALNLTVTQQQKQNGADDSSDVDSAVLLIWHDLATCYLAHAQSLKHEGGDKELCEELMDKAQCVARYCSGKNPTYWQHWNLLGNIAFYRDPPDYRLAQHALIKATIADNNSAISWSNLGVLYFTLGDMKLANEAFSQAQRSDPNFVNSWIGQALLAESLDHHDAMDLFRHSTQLGVHQQGALGYGHWVCKTLKESPIDAVIYSIHNMHAIPVACDHLTWYADTNPNDSAAWNMLGILKERMGLNKGATEAFRKALALAESKNKDWARVNYGRTLAKLGRYEEAIRIFSQVEKATFNSGSGLALALFKDQHYKESYESYEQALHWLAEEQSSQSDLLVALAAMAYMFEGAEAAKTLLFQSIQLDNPSPFALFATLSLGLLHDDMNLAQLVFKELEKVKDQKNCVRHFATLTACLYLIKSDCKKAIVEISKLVHRHPDEGHLWLVLSSAIIRLESQGQSLSNSAKAAANCAQAAMKLGRTQMDVSKVLCLVSQASLISGDHKQSLLSAQKAVHLYPNVAEGWAVLSTALLKNPEVRSCERNFKKSKIKRILGHVEALSESKDLTNWAQSVF